MNASNWIELGLGLATLLGGGTVGVSKLTRIAVAAETLAEKIQALAGQQKSTSATVQDHEIRLAKGGL